MPVTNMLSENSLGHVDNLLTHMQTSSIKFISDHLVLRSGGQMVYGTGEAKEVRKLIPKLDELEKNIDDVQRKKKSDSVLSLKGKAGLYHKRRLHLLERCKSHGGPFSKPSDVLDFQERCRNEKWTEAQMKKALKDEVAYARETITKRPKTDDVFRIRDRITNKDLSSEKFFSNLKCLFDDIYSVADVSIADLCSAIAKAKAAAGIDAIPSREPQETASQDQVLSHLSVSDFVCIAVKNDSGDKGWKLGLVHELKPNLLIMTLSPVGENGVVFKVSEECAPVQVTPECILPFTPIVIQKVIDDEFLYLCKNHEELDRLLNNLKE